MAEIRLVFEVPHTTQVANDQWINATYLKTVCIEVIPDVAELLENGARIIGGEIVEPSDAP